MVNLELIGSLRQPAETTIVLLVLDGLGGLAEQPGNRTALETARTPHLDALAGEGICGLHEPIGPGITPGSGPAHLALFGYDPVEYQVGRGVLSALGIGFDLEHGDVAARGNFCTLDDDGLVADRRAGRISSETGAELCEKLRAIDLPDAELFVEPVKEHRFVLVLRGDDLHGDIEATDPQAEGEPPIEAAARASGSERAADLVRRFVGEARNMLAGEPANGVLLRGFSRRPDWPDVRDVFGLRAAALAAYPMYRGVARLVGMDALEVDGRLPERLEVMQRNWDDYDYFFLHVKGTDSAGEDNDFDRKVHLIEEVDEHLPTLREQAPDVILVTGDHSTPSRMEEHSWHPVPVMLWSPRCRPDRVTTFGERACLAGALGPRLPATHLMPLALANAERLAKYGA
ncbi:MAG: 2,3-bisphosphoglycerate-independent phosphoglycerate mutase [Planctomycetota bacterium]|nr:2,3-bisphosphoglycerate-independent phosphoglycerate mutase [Planctomycetota bacterium]